MISWMDGWMSNVSRCLFTAGQRSAGRCRFCSLFCFSADENQFLETFHVYPDANGAEKTENSSTHSRKSAAARCKHCLHSFTSFKSNKINFLNKYVKISEINLKMFCFLFLANF